MNRLIYLDNAATSFPKAPGVAKAMIRYLEEIGGNPGRSGHRLSIEAGRMVYRCRTQLAKLFGVSETERVLFTKNATEAINLALSLLKTGDRVVVTPMQHNAVMRPLNAMVKRLGLVVDRVEPPNGESLSVEHWLHGFREICGAGPLRMVVVNHGSNVVGEVVPLEEIVRVAKEYGALVLVDAAQTAGVLPIAADEWGIDFLAFTGHKGLYGPKGTGGLVIGGSELPPPLVMGGTGSRSEEEVQPAMLPDLYEGGTPNVEGIVGLGAALDWLKETGALKIHLHEMELLNAFRDGVKGIPKVSFWGPEGDGVAVCSLRFDGMDPAWVTATLDSRYGVLTRPGLHCAPGAHKAIGTFPEGTVRFSFGYFNSMDHVEAAVSAVREIAGGLV